MNIRVIYDITGVTTGLECKHIGTGCKKDNEGYVLSYFLMDRVVNVLIWDR